MLILLRFMETHGVALGYVGDKIRSILIIRVRFTTVFFFSNTDLSLSLQKNATQSHKLQNNQGKSMIAEDSFVPLL